MIEPEKMYVRMVLMVSQHCVDIEVPQPNIFDFNKFCQYLRECGYYTNTVSLYIPYAQIQTIMYATGSMLSKPVSQTQDIIIPDGATKQ